MDEDTTLWAKEYFGGVLRGLVFITLSPVVLLIVLMYPLYRLGMWIKPKP